MFHLFGMIREKGAIIISKELISEVLKNTNYLTKEDIIVKVGDIISSIQGVDIHFFTDIGQALKGTRTQSGGYKWQYQMN